MNECQIIDFVHVPDNIECFHVDSLQEKNTIKCLRCNMVVKVMNSAITKRETDVKRMERLKHLIQKQDAE